MEGRKRSRSLEVFFALALFCAFSVCTLLTLMTGANVYRQSVRANDERYCERTALAYVKTVLRGGNILDGISIETFGDGSALVLTEKIGDNVCKTYIYRAYGYMREIYTLEGIEIDPYEGTPIVPVQGLDFKLVSNGLIKVTFTSAGGNVFVSYVKILNGEEAVWR